MINHSLDVILLSGLVIVSSTTGTYLHTLIMSLLIYYNNTFEFSLHFCNGVYRLCHSFLLSNRLRLVVLCYLPRFWGKVIISEMRKIKWHIHTLMYSTLCYILILKYCPKMAIRCYCRCCTFTHWMVSYDIWWLSK